MSIASCDKIPDDFFSLSIHKKTLVSDLCQFYIDLVTLILPSSPIQPKAAQNQQQTFTISNQNFLQIKNFIYNLSTKMVNGESVTSFRGMHVAPVIKTHLTAKSSLTKITRATFATKWYL